MKNDNGNPEILTLSSHVSQNLKQTIKGNIYIELCHMLQYHQIWVLFQFVKNYITLCGVMELPVW